MRRTIIQIGQVLIILVIILSIPLLAQSRSIQKGLKSTPEILTESVSDGKVLGESTQKTTIKKSVAYEYSKIQIAAFYTILTLVIISAASFTKYKFSNK
jgi:hypothetical protein